jgi:DNA-binding MarR family transcriptional regulator
MAQPRYFLTYYLKTLLQHVRGELDDAVKPLGLTGQQVAVLSLLRRPGASNAELARETGVTPQSMVEQLLKLEKAGLVFRTQDPRNARVLRTALTAKGLQALGRGGAEIARVEERLLAPLSSKERRALQEALERCVNTLPERDPQPASQRGRRPRGD